MAIFEAVASKLAEWEELKNKTVDIRWLPLADPVMTAMKKTRIIEAHAHAKFGKDWLSGSEVIGNSVGGGGGEGKKLFLRPNCPRGASGQ